MLIDALPLASMDPLLQDGMIEKVETSMIILGELLSLRVWTLKGNHVYFPVLLSLLTHTIQDSMPKWRERGKLCC